MFVYAPPPIYACLRGLLRHRGEMLVITSAAAPCPEMPAVWRRTTTVMPHQRKTAPRRNGGCFALTEILNSAEMAAISPNQLRVSCLHGHR